MSPPTKLYAHIGNVYGDEGEAQGALAVAAVVDPSRHYPADGRIIVGVPAASARLPGPLPKLASFNMGITAAEELIATLQQAVLDVRRAMRAGGDEYPRGPEILALARAALEDDVAWPRPPWTPDIDDPGTRAERWTGKWELANGHALEAYENPQVARYVADMREREPILASAVATLAKPVGQGIEVWATDTAYDEVLEDDHQETTVFHLDVYPDGHVIRMRVIVRHGRQFAIQYRNTVTHLWDPVTYLATGITPDAVMAVLLGRLCHLGATHQIWRTASVVSEDLTVPGVTSIQMGCLYGAPATPDPPEDW